jgi:hypothetical protein
MKFLIINADDFGLSGGICKSILELLGCGAITNTSLMVAAPDATTMIRKWGGKNLLGLAGVHLQLTAGAPLETTNELTTLVDPISKRFRDPRKGPPVLAAEAEIEWRKQINTACDLLGGLPTHLDSHHGVHRIPELFDVYRKLAAEFGIPMRGAVSGTVKDIIQKDNLKATVAIVREWTGRLLDYKNLISQIETVAKDNPKEKVIEVISHPGYNDKYLESISSFSTVRENDHSVLLSLAKQNWWSDAGYKLISYRDFYHGLN